jgi:hypothetical protein
VRSQSRPNPVASSTRTHLNLVFKTPRYYCQN